MEVVLDCDEVELSVLVVLVVVISGDTGFVLLFGGEVVSCAGSEFEFLVGHWTVLSSVMVAVAVLCVAVEVCVVYHHSEKVT